MTSRVGSQLPDVHTLARSYHWAEREILGLAMSRRSAYLMLLEEDADAALLAGLGGETR